VNLGADRPVHGVPVHGTQEDYTEEGSVDGDYPPTEGSESSDAVWRSSPERDEGSGAFSTPRIPKRGDPPVDPASPVAHVNALRALPPPPREKVSYAVPEPAARQLTKSDLESFDRKLLNSIEGLARSAPYFENIHLRNVLILDTELRTSNALTIFFRNGGVTELAPGYDLSLRDRAWKGVTNTDRVLQCDPHGMEQPPANGGRQPGWDIFNQCHVAECRRGLARELGSLCVY
jgi:hypothetical protein